MLHKCIPDQTHLANATNQAVCGILGRFLRCFARLPGSGTCTRRVGKGNG
jgi:hypothetical protein